MNNFITLLTLILTTFYGFLIIRSFNIRNFSSKLKLGLGFGVGFGIISCQMFLYSLLNFEWNTTSIILPHVVTTTIFLIRKPILPLRIRVVGSDTINNFLSMLILGLVVFVFFEAAIRPLSAWDGWASWQMKAKIYYTDGTITQESFQYLVTDYPLAVSLYSTFIYTVLEEIDDTSILLVSSFFYAMIGLVAYATLRTKTSTTYSLIFTFLILSTQNLIRHGGRFEAGMADIVLAYFILACISSLHVALDRKDMKILTLLFILLGITSQIKNEGIIFSIMVFTISLIYSMRKGLTIPLLGTLFFIVPFIGWFIFKQAYNLPSGILSIVPTISLKSALEIAKTEILQILNIKNWNLGWLFVIATLALSIRMRKVSVLFTIIFLQFFFYFVVFFFSNQNPAQHAEGIIDRLYLHLFPSSVVIAALLLYAIIKKRSYL